MAELIVAITCDTPTGHGLMFLDLLCGDILGGHWWTWDDTQGWFGPVVPGRPARASRRGAVDRG